MVILFYCKSSSMTAQLCFLQSPWQFSPGDKMEPLWLSGLQWVHRPQSSEVISSLWKTSRTNQRAAGETLNCSLRRGTYCASPPSEWVTVCKDKPLLCIQPAGWDSCTSFMAVCFYKMCLIMLPQNTNNGVTSIWLYFISSLCEKSKTLQL